MEKICSMCGTPIGAIINFDKTCSKACKDEIALRISSIKPHVKDDSPKASLDEFYINLAEAKLKKETDTEYADRILKPIWNNNGVWQKGATRL